MQKVYLLLRSNKQTGPYSLEELLQLNLKPFDLVWVDGRSAAWQYPFEIPALKPYVPETPHAEVPFQPVATEAMEEKQVPGHSFQQPQNPVPDKTETPKRVFVSVPKTYTASKEQETYASVKEPKTRVESDFVQHKAYMPPVESPLPQGRQEQKQAPTSYGIPVQTPVGEEIVSTNYSRSLQDVESDYTKWVYEQKAKKKKVSVSPKDMVLAVLILVVIGGGYYVMSKPSVANAIVPTNKAVAPVTQAAEEPNAAEPKEILSPEQRVVASTATKVSNPEQTKHPKNIKTKNLNSVSKAQTVSSVPTVQNSIPAEKPSSNIHESNNEISSPEPQVKQEPKETTEKKKKLGEVIKGIFTRKDKIEEPKSENPVPENPRSATNRQASRRDDAADGSTGSKEVSSASLMDQVDLTSNSPDNWMLGVKNLKITLRNRSNATIQTATVTVSYYDENNQLLDKKLVYFNNVAPKTKATVAAPDQKFADHVEYRLTTISGKEDRYASN